MSIRIRFIIIIDNDLPDGDDLDQMQSNQNQEDNANDSPSVGLKEKKNITPA